VTDPRGRVLVLNGPPGSGKTTVARFVAARFKRAVHLQHDEFFHVIRSGYVEPWKTGSHEQNEVVFRVVGDAATRYAKAGYFTIIDGVIVPWYYPRFRRRLQKAELDVATAILRPSLAACTSRAGRRASIPLAETGFRPLAEPAVIEQMWQEFADLGPLERHLIDNDALGPEATADEVMTRLRNP
jgi:predicted kinase